MHSVHSCIQCIQCIHAISAFVHSVHSCIQCIRAFMHSVHLVAAPPSVPDLGMVGMNHCPSHSSRVGVNRISIIFRVMVKVKAYGRG